jgi:AbrB family looped-hinge helix DNA binding protein
MSEIIEMGTVSSRGQIAIPTEIRKEMDLKEGQKVIFFLEESNILLVKKVNTQTFSELTKPLREAAKKSGMKEDAVNLVHRFRKSK